MRKFLFFLLLFSTCASWAQSDTCFDPNSKAYYRCERNVERICKEYLIDDLIELEEKLLTVHPDAYAYCGKEVFDGSCNGYARDRLFLLKAGKMFTS